MVATAAKRSTSGYRLYGENDVLRLQQILIYRELGLPLEQIRRTLDDPEFDLREALVRQRERLSQQANHASAMIRSVDAALKRIEGDTTMGARERLVGARSCARAGAEIGDAVAAMKRFRLPARRSR